VIGLAEWLRRRAVRSADRPALTCDDVTWTYREFQARIERLSAALAATGVGIGDRVGYLGFNHPMFLVGLFAAARLGAVFVPLNFRLTGPEIEFAVNDSGVRTLLVGAEHLATVEAIRDTLCCQRYLSVDPGAPGWEAATDLMETAAPVPAVEVVGDDVAAILYTSGTTGNPKGAMLTHGNFWSAGTDIMLCMDFVSTDVSLNFAPLFHVGGLSVVTLPLMQAGGHVVLQRAFDPVEVMRAIARYKVTASFAVPAMLLFMSQHPDFAAADLSSLRSIAVGGAPVPEPLLKLYGERGIPVHQGYGMTETVAINTFLSPDKAAAKLGSCGTGPLLTQFTIKDPKGNRLTVPGARGEVCVRGPNVMKGYWNRPDANAAVFDAEGWFHTGDVGYIDDEGYLFLCDRLKDMVISGGENVYPAEIESVLSGHPAVAEIAVIGAPDEKWGERVVAVAALRPGASLTLDDLRAFGQKSLARYKLPLELRLVDALPRNPTGKILKTALRAANPR
jgi:fatty-acyl-CoA synthase